ncbi:MAG TPA: hypothetical protein VFN92_08380 [Solirubrobacterales bacterium]|nr:hypothetical protein [Solirubrobacterales bacterium]
MAEKAAATASPGAAAKQQSPATWRRRSLVRVRRPSWATAEPQRPVSR